MSGKIELEILADELAVIYENHLNDGFTHGGKDPRNVVTPDELMQVLRPHLEGAHDNAIQAYKDM